MKLISKILTTLFVTSFLLMPKDALSDENKYIKFDKQLKSLIAKNPDSSSKMVLFNFVEKDRSNVDIYHLKANDGKAFIPQDELAIMLYDKYIEQGFLPIISVLETNKQFLDAIEKTEE